MTAAAVITGAAVLTGTAVVTGAAVVTGEAMVNTAAVWFSQQVLVLPTSHGFLQQVMGFSNK